MNAMKPKVGDVAEIRTPEGLAYVQYTHDGQGNGELVRVLPGLYDSRPDLVALVIQHELYFIFYTLKYAIRDKQAEIVCNLPIPERARSEPLMRHASGESAEGKVTGWRIVSALDTLSIDFETNSCHSRTYAGAKEIIHSRDSAASGNGEGTPTRLDSGARGGF